ncbi:MAG TPA: DUF3606 domain-containing protein [Pantoea sp.]|jgi:hypothetical protein|uniref:DUF3606 domain-containing protein n=1 Tax=Pantoea TaxID=53335 RepID=UPI0005356D25|nr:MULTISPECIES: DUF3606 domain-containing protein [Pantoea]MBS6434888.1 DUF3606 domain-containing protein [Pantoea sp.]MDU1573654.1 DUF3606 domain-containing protein [Pantoea sp.]MDU2728560.1 DUF3606 domain-containing protein [Pantoea sp.]MDU5472684.1 DUF3606 domain-containing protein [Pantoea sp.]MDU6078868.1 DUF3606 domain-containing protein [Pantoea sp.]
MRDPIVRRVPADLSCVEVNEQWQITFWMLTLHITQDRLIRAVKEAGPDVEKVRRWLKDNPPSRRPCS